MNCHLLVSDLFWPASAGIEPYRGLALPALETLLGRGRRERSAGASLERWLARAFRLPEALPLAPYSLRGDGAEPGTECWMRADPVHLKVHGDRLILADASRLALTPEEARELVTALAPHFARDGMALTAPSPQRWYLRLADEPRLLTTPTAEVAGRSIEPFLPAGADGARWRSIANEAQMLLHEHSCNEAREARGQLSVNSVWLWGTGRAQKTSSPYDALWSDDPLARGLAAAGSGAAHPLPDSAAPLLSQPGSGTQLVVPRPLPTTAYGDLASWREAVVELERLWLAPLLAGLRDGALQSITLHGLGPDWAYAAELTRSDRWRFWLPRRPLHAYAA